MGMTGHWILSCLGTFHDQAAMIWRDQTISYDQLLRGVDEWTQELDKHRVAAGEVVALIGDYSPRAVALLLALIARRCVAVPLRREGAAGQTEQLLSLAETEVVVALNADDTWTLTRRPAAASAPLIRELRDRGEPGWVVFTSGSTGASKAILHSFDRLLAKFRRPRPAMRTLVFLLLNHIGGINTLFSILTGGGAAVSISERTADAICQAIAQWRVELLPTSPTFLNMLLISEVFKKYDLSSLRMITYGTEPMPPTTLRRLAAAFPGVRLKQTYGLSELGILPTHSAASDSLKLRMGGEGFEIRIKDGTLFIKSPSAMLGYLNHPSPFDEQGWMNTGDLVEVDGEWVRIVGRSSELINVGGEKVNPAEVEDLILQLDNVREVTVRGHRSPITGNIVKACVVPKLPEDADQLKQRIREFCQARLPRYKVPVLIEIDETGGPTGVKKIRREA